MNLGILGCGLIGGSAALAWRRAFPGSEVAAWDPDAGALERALEAGAITRIARDPAEAAAGSGLILAAGPVPAIPGSVAAAAPGAGPDAVFTDAGSVKAPVVEGVARSAPAVAFVGGHPMAGTEQQGFAAARADLFAGAWWFLTPDSEASTEAAARIEPALRALGAKVVRMEPAAHDRIVASVSHLPMLVAAALVDLAGIPISGHDPRTFAGSGFRDLTRIADSNPQLWLDICLENAPAVIEALSGLGALTQRLERSLFEQDREGLLGFLGRARESRSVLPEKADRPALRVIVVDVPDAPGTLASVAATLGDAGVNIEDIRVAHSTSGERGWFFLTVAADKVPACRDALAGAGFASEELR